MPLPHNRKSIPNSCPPWVLPGFLIICIVVILTLPTTGRSTHQTTSIATSPRNTQPWATGSRADSGTILIASPPQIGHRYDYVTITGEVTNLSPRPLRHVKAVVEIFDSSERLRAIETALIAFSPLSAGENSPYRVQCRYNQEIGSFRVRFRHLLGAPIPTRDR
jgi:hypothetical protein